MNRSCGIDNILASVSPVSAEDLARAAATVCRHATDSADAAGLLSMLGLLPGRKAPVDDQPKPVEVVVLSSCERCQEDTPGNTRRGMCPRCYADTRSRALAAGRWNPNRVDTTEALARVDALVAMGMCMLHIRRRAGIPQTTFHTFTTGRPCWTRGEVVEGVLSVPVPARVADWICLAQGQELVPAVGAVRRLHALIAAGWPAAELARRMGFYPSEITQMLHSRTRIRASRHRQIAALFDTLQFEPGPSEVARKRGRANRWPLPMQWDEDVIDEPDGRPAPNSRRYQRKATG